MKRQLFAAVMLLLLGMTAACNTIHGFGRDVQGAGEATEDAADAVKRRM